MQLLAYLGVGPRRPAAERRGFVAFEQEISYQREVKVATTLHVDSKVVDYSEKTLRYRHTMRDSETGDVLSEMELLVALISLDQRRTAPLLGSARMVVTPYRSTKFVGLERFRHQPHAFGRCSELVAAAKNDDAVPVHFMALHPGRSGELPKRDGEEDLAVGQPERRGWCCVGFAQSLPSDPCPAWSA